jgi:hypothetical protein
MEKRYESCTLTDLAQLAGMDLRTFQKRISPTDLKQMVDLGWNPFERSLLPPVVRYLRDRFVDAPKLMNPPML